MRESEESTSGGTGVAPILIVDDDASIVRAVRRLLDRVCPTLGATTIADANHEIERVGRLTALILDVHLAEGSGWEILVTARARDPLLPAMMLTGMRWQTLAQQAQEFHAVPCEKPLEAERARTFAEEALASQSGAEARMRGLVHDLAVRSRLTPAEAEFVEAQIATFTVDRSQPSPRVQDTAQRSLVASVMVKTGVKSPRELRDALLRSYFTK